MPRVTNRSAASSDSAACGGSRRAASSRFPVAIFSSPSAPRLRASRVSPCTRFSVAFGPLGFLHRECLREKLECFARSADTKIGLAHRHQQIDMHVGIAELVVPGPFDAALEQFLGGQLLALGCSRVGTAKYVEQKLQGLLRLLTLAARDVPLHACLVGLPERGGQSAGESGQGDEGQRCSKRVTTQEPRGLDSASRRDARPQAGAAGDFRYRWRNRRRWHSAARVACATLSGQSRQDHRAARGAGAALTSRAVRRAHRDRHRRRSP